MRVQAESAEFGEEQLVTGAVDGFAAVEGETQPAQVDVGDPAGVPAEHRIGEVRCRREGCAALGEPAQPAERGRRERSRRRQPHLRAADEAGQQEGQAHVVVQRQPGAADIAARIHGGVLQDPGDVVEHRRGGQQRGARGSGGPGGALQDGWRVGRGRLWQQSGRTSGMSHLDRVVHGQSGITVAQQVQAVAVAEHLRHPDVGEAGGGRGGPLAVVGAAHRARQDGHRAPGQPRPLNGGDDLDRGFTDQADSAVENTFGDVLGAGVHLLPGVTPPLGAVAVQDHQVVW